MIFIVIVTWSFDFTYGPAVFEKELADTPAVCCLRCLHGQFLTPQLCLQYGPINQIIIPRPGAPTGVGKVILNFADVTSAMAAQRVMNGRKFAGRTVIATFMTDDQLAAGSLD